MLFLSVSCFSVSAGRLLGLGHAPGRRKELGHLDLCGLDRAERRGSDQLRGPPPFGHVDPRLRSLFQFHAGAWESWCWCCCLIPADRPWAREWGRRWRLEVADPRSVHETRFEAAVKVIQSLPKNGSFQPTNEMMLKFYGFYKQATEGPCPCKLSRPGFWDPIGRYKWDAWSSLGDMTKEEAMIAYVEEIKKKVWK
ncbi:acyl-CoA-binding domain-containing protein 5-like isoform X2 [Eumetopias jubatus]|uniref:acyl-CoA-binding domain-containing protein 5-like isoform X2 n=1 Tax=Eumetopias jubatus TaxID=34886 RepID=UPI001016922E|nr:acyl-CoA-binding domain-containing protein 5-like isoform X2 [Eumetopias jubatus]